MVQAPPRAHLVARVSCACLLCRGRSYGYPVSDCRCDACDAARWKQLEDPLALDFATWLLEQTAALPAPGEVENRDDGDRRRDDGGLPPGWPPLE